MFLLLIKDSLQIKFVKFVKAGGVTQKIFIIITSIFILISGIEVKENDLIQADTVDDASYKPPINREASTVEDVYNVKNLVPLSVLAESAEDISSVLESDEASIR